MAKSCVAFLMEEKDKKKVRIAAAGLGLSMSEFIRQAVDHYLDMLNLKQEIAALSESMEGAASVERFMNQR